MPEIVEVEKLFRQIKVWHCLPIKRIYGPPESKKYLVGFGRDWLKGHDYRITGFGRHGKFICLNLSDFTVDFVKQKTFSLIQIHLSSTGWILPGNELAKSVSTVDPIKDNFIHKINEKTLRFSIELGDGQVWDYHDPRTWGRWVLYEGVEDWEQLFKDYGPDWLESQKTAKEALVSLTGTKRTVKDILCDQRITAGVGNYLACEGAFLAGIHPHRRWNTLDNKEKVWLSNGISEVITSSLEASDHSHWAVFLRKGEGCRTCGTLIEYRKDSKSESARGSYFCPNCQEY